MADGKKYCNVGGCPRQEGGRVQGKSRGEEKSRCLNNYCRDKTEKLEGERESLVPKAKKRNKTKQNKGRRVQT